MARPLENIRIVEMAAIGPVPFASLLLSSMGAQIIRITPQAAEQTPAFSMAVQRGRRNLALDLKKPEGRNVALCLIEKADALVEGFRPGVMERLGLNPDRCLASNPRLIFARTTGWGQSGPLAQQAGHDINYIALSGALHAIGADAPIPPLNLVGDYAGGSMFLLFGLLCALLEAQRTGRGQVIDVSMTEGAIALMTTFYDRVASGRWKDARLSNRVDGGAPFYAVYETSDGKYVAVGAVEATFWRQLLRVLELDEGKLPSRDKQENWPAIRSVFSEIFKGRTRDEWASRADGADACITPVLSLAEAPFHPQNVARGAFQKVDGAWIPSPTPRLSRTPAAITSAETAEADSAADLLLSWSVPPHLIDVAIGAKAL